MQLKMWLALGLVAGILHVAAPIILVSTAAATTAAVTLTVSNVALAAIGGAAALLGLAGLLAIKGGGRHRRQAIADDGFSANAVDILFSAAGALDQETNCGLRLVCELAATPEDQLASDEQLIMNLFGSQAPISNDKINNHATPFQLAVFLGRQSADVSACGNTYTKCQFNSHQIMEILRENGNGQL
ncbi:unnamed protein product, partial [Meganyctiphanes norvegica]